MGLALGLIVAAPAGRLLVGWGGCEADCGEGGDWVAAFWARTGAAETRTATARVAANFNIGNSGKLSLGANAASRGEFRG